MSYLGARSCSLTWDALKPLRPVITARVFHYITTRPFSRADFAQTSATQWRIIRPILTELLSTCTLPTRDIETCAEWMLGWLWKARRDAVTLGLVVGGGTRSDNTGARAVRYTRRTGRTIRAGVVGLDRVV
jgi:hypothetical protein